MLSMKFLAALLTKIGPKKTRAASEAEKELKEVARLGQSFLLMELK